MRKKIKNIYNINVGVSQPLNEKVISECFAILNVKNKKEVKIIFCPLLFRQKNDTVHHFYDSKPPAVRVVPKSL